MLSLWVHSCTILTPFMNPSSRQVSSPPTQPIKIRASGNSKAGWYGKRFHRPAPSPNLVIFYCFTVHCLTHLPPTSFCSHGSRGIFHLRRVWFFFWSSRWTIVSLHQLPSWEYHPRTFFTYSPDSVWSHFKAHPGLGMGVISWFLLLIYCALPRTIEGWEPGSNNTVILWDQKII